MKDNNTGTAREVELIGALRAQAGDDGLPNEAQAKPGMLTQINPRGPKARGENSPGQRPGEMTLHDTWSKRQRRD